MIILFLICLVCENLNGVEIHSHQFAGDLSLKQSIQMAVFACLYFFRTVIIAEVVKFC